MPENPWKEISHTLVKKTPTQTNPKLHFPTRLEYILITRCQYLIC